MRPLRAIGLWGPLLGFMAALLLMASRPDSAFFEPFGDKALHVLAYFILGFLMLRALHAGVGPLRLLPTCLAMLFTLAYGGLEEWAQSRVPQRDSSAVDWAADAVGAGCSIVFTALLAALIGRRRGKE